MRPGAIVRRSPTRTACRARSRTPPTGDSRKGRRTASQIRSVRAASRRQSAPAGGPNAASIRALVTSRSPAVSSRVPSANRCRISGSSGCSSSPAGHRSPVAANRSANTAGMVSSDGPVSNRNVPASVSRCSRPSLPPSTSACSQTVTSWPRAARRAAADSPPTPAPTTTTRLTAAAVPSRSACRPGARAASVRSASRTRPPRRGCASASGQARPPVRRAVSTRPVTPAAYPAKPVLEPSSAASGGTR